LYYFQTKKFDIGSIYASIVAYDNDPNIYVDIFITDTINYSFGEKININDIYNFIKNIKKEEKEIQYYCKRYFQKTKNESENIKYPTIEKENNDNEI